MPYCNNNTFQIFLDAIATDNPEKFKILVLDNGAFHHAKHLRIPDNVALIFLQPNSPELNPAEKMWRYIKDRISMVAYESVEKLLQKITMVLTLIKPTLVKSICGNKFYKNTFYIALKVLLILLLHEVLIHF